MTISIYINMYEATQISIKSRYKAKTKTKNNFKT